MVDLQQYEEYFRELSQALPGIGSMIPVTYDIDIYEYVQSPGRKTCLYCL
ncbi:hypothetical protein NXV95_15990 [Bacteroides fragilis]|nr:hypothetical protein [Bacteroides fragilis]